MFAYTTFAAQSDPRTLRNKPEWRENGEKQRKTVRKRCLYKEVVIGRRSCYSFTPTILHMFCLNKSEKSHERRERSPEKSEKSLKKSAEKSAAEFVLYNIVE